MFGLFRNRNKKVYKRKILKGVQDMLDFYSDNDHYGIAIDDNAGNLLITFELTNMSLRKLDIRNFKQFSSNDIEVVFEKVRFGWTDIAVTWKANRFRIDIEDNISEDFDFRQHLADTLIDIFVEDLQKAEDDLYDIDLLDNIGIVSESSLNDKITILEFFHRVYTTLGKQYDVKYHVFQQKVRNRILGVMMNTFAHGTSIPTRVVEFLQCVNKMIPCVDTLDDRVYVLGKASSRPFIFKRNGNLFIRVDIFDEEYKRHMLADQLVDSTHQ